MKPLVCALAAAALAFASARAVEPPPLKEVHLSLAPLAGSQVRPKTKVLNADGKLTGLPDQKGKPMIVNIWATWCGGCVQEMPTLADLARTYAGKISVVTVSRDDLEHREKAREFIARFEGLTFLQDPKNELSEAISPAIKEYPSTILYDGSGHERARLPGATADWNSPSMHRLVDQLIAAS